MDIKTTCPLGSECEQIKNDQVHRCKWYVHLQGKDPQSEKMIDQWDCAITWLPMLLVENAQTNRGQTSALESLRNEVVNIPRAKTIQAIAKGFTGLYLMPEETTAEGKLRALWLPVGLLIPCFIDGQIQRLRIRRLKEAFEKFGPKYYIVPGSKMGTMLLEPESKVFVVVEAELDALAIVEAAGDFAGAVAVGSLANKPDASTTGKLRGCLQILNALDYEVGKKDSCRALLWWSKNFDNCDRWPVPKGKDPGEARQAGVNLREWIRSGLPPGMRLTKSGLTAAYPPKERAVTKVNS